MLPFPFLMLILRVFSAVNSLPRETVSCFWEQIEFWKRYRLMDSCILLWQYYRRGFTPESPVSSSSHVTVYSEKLSCRHPPRQTHRSHQSPASSNHLSHCAEELTLP